MKKVALDEIYQPSADLVVETALDGQLMLVPVNSGIPSGPPALMTLNPVGLAIWKKLDGRTPLSEVISTLCRDFDGEEHVIAGDVCGFIADLLQKGLLVEHGKPAV